MLLSEKVRIEVFIPDLPDPPIQGSLRNCNRSLVIPSEAARSYRPQEIFYRPAEQFFPDKITILFTDVILTLARDRLLIGQYTNRLSHTAQEALKSEETILVSVYSVYHDE